MICPHGVNRIGGVCHECDERSSAAAGSIQLRVGDYARCLVPLKKPGKWGNRSIIVRNVTVTGIVGQYVQVKVSGRDGTVAIPRNDIQEFWRHDGEQILRSNREVSRSPSVDNTKSLP